VHLIPATLCGSSLLPVVMTWWVTYSVIYFPASIAWRKEGTTVRELFWAGSRAATSPARYFRADRVRTITVMNLIGVGGFMIGMLTVVAGPAICGP
jgi:hypothetical protein